MKVRNGLITAKHRILKVLTGYQPLYLPLCHATLRSRAYRCVTERARTGLGIYREPSRVPFYGRNHNSIPLIALVLWSIVVLLNVLVYKHTIGLTSTVLWTFFCTVDEVDRHQYSRSQSCSDVCWLARDVLR